jgi:hypothetical protein
MFREADERERQLHPSYRNKPVSTMQFLSQNARLDDSATHDKIQNVEYQSNIPAAVPTTFDTYFDPSHPDADWSGMVSIKNAQKKHTRDHASQRLGIVQCEEGIVAKEERQEWAHRRPAAAGCADKNTSNIELRDDCNYVAADRFKTEYNRFSEHEGTSRDQLTMEKRQKPIRKIADPAQARSLREQMQQNQQQSLYGGSSLAGNSPRTEYGAPLSVSSRYSNTSGNAYSTANNIFGTTSGGGSGGGGSIGNESPREGGFGEYDLSEQEQRQLRERAYQQQQQQQQRAAAGASFGARGSLVSGIAAQISNKVQAPVKPTNTDVDFSKNRILVTDNYKPFPG